MWEPASGGTILLWSVARTCNRACCISVPLSHVHGLLCSLLPSPFNDFLIAKSSTKVIYTRDELVIFINIRHSAKEQEQAAMAGRNHIRGLCTVQIC